MTTYELSGAGRQLSAPHVPLPSESDTPFRRVIPFEMFNVAELVVV